MIARSRHALVRGAWTLAVALGVVLVVKMFVCDVKHVDSGSMAPTILGSRENGESVLVLYGAFEPERFDFAVITREGESLPIVKRIAGLPKESVQIANGDLRIDGKRLPASTPRPEPIPVFDDRFESVDEIFERPARATSSWRRSSDGWMGLWLESQAVAAGSVEGLMTLHRPLSNGYLDRDGAFVPGDMDVNDAVFECEVLARELAGRIVVEFVEQGDLFRFLLEPKAPGMAEASIVRCLARKPGETGVGPEEVLSKRIVPFHSWTRIRCANVDNGVSFEVSGTPEVLCAQYDENRFDPSDRLMEGRSSGPRVRFGGEGARLVFRSIRILRDVQYTPRDTFGVNTPIDLGPDEYFALGDNSSESRDSREWGPVRRSQIIGRPIWVVWPPGHARKLVPTVSPVCGR